MDDSDSSRIRVAPKTGTVSRRMCGASAEVAGRVVHPVAHPTTAYAR
jgi:hypothetical protein